MITTVSLIIGIHIVHECGQGDLGIYYHIAFLVQMKYYVRTQAMVSSNLDCWVASMSSYAF